MKVKYRSQRPQDVEAVFGNLKNNKHFKRFHLRGLKKVEIEFGLLAIATCKSSLLGGLWQRKKFERMKPSKSKFINSFFEKNPNDFNWR